MPLILDLTIVIFQGGIHRYIQYNNGINVHKNIQTIIFKKSSPRNIQFNSQTNTQWSNLISPVPQLVLLTLILSIK